MLAVFALPQDDIIPLGIDFTDGVWRHTKMPNMHTYAIK